MASHLKYIKKQTILDGIFVTSCEYNIKDPT